MNLERCKEKLEREAKHATAGIFGGRSWSTDFWGMSGSAAEEVRVERVGDEKGRKRKMAGIFVFIFRDWAMARSNADHGK
jgi:hypothetical protein